MPLRNFEKVFPGKEKFIKGLEKYQCKDLAAKLGVNQSTISYWKNQHLTKEERQAELCLELREMQKVNRKYSSAGLTQDYVDRAEELRTEIIRLNRSAI